MLMGYCNDRWRTDSFVLTDYFISVHQNSVDMFCRFAHKKKMVFYLVVFFNGDINNTDIS